MSDNAEVMKAAVFQYDRYKNRDKAIAALTRNGLKEAVAAIAVDEYIAAIKAANRKAAVGPMILGLVIFLAALGIFLVSGVLFWYALPAGGVLFLFGLARMIFGFSMRSGEE